MKFSSIALLAATHCAVAYELQYSVLIDPIKTGIIEGVVAGRHSDIPEAQALSEVEQFVPLIMNDDLLPVFDNAVALVVGSSDFSSEFPAWISDVIQALDDYKKSPDFTSATELLSSYLPHYDYHEAVKQASLSINAAGAWQILVRQVKGISDEPAPSSAIVDGLYAVTGLICTLQLTDGSFCDPYRSGAPASSSENVAPVTSTSPAPVTSSGPVPKPDGTSTGAAPSPTTVAVSSTDSPATQTSDTVPKFTTAPITKEDVVELNTMLTDVTDVLGDLAAELPDSPELKGLIDDVSTTINDLVSKLPDLFARRSLVKRQNSVEDVSAEELSESVLPLLEKLREIVDIIEPVEDKSEALQANLDKLLDLITKLEGWVETVTAPVPIAEVSSSAAPSSPEASSSSVPEASPSASASGSQSAPMSSSAGFNNATVSGTAVTDSDDLVTSSLTLTVTHCDNEGHCITPTMDVTTVVPKNAPTTVIKTVCPKCEGKTVEITVPCGCAPGPTEAAKPKADSESNKSDKADKTEKSDKADKADKADEADKTEKTGSTEKSGNGGSSDKSGTPDKASTGSSDKPANGGSTEPKPASPAQAPKAAAPAQANSGNKWVVSGGAMLAGVLALLA